MQWFFRYHEVMVIEVRHIITNSCETNQRTEKSDHLKDGTEETSTSRKGKFTIEKDTSSFFIDSACVKFYLRKGHVQVKKRGRSPINQNS